MDQKPAGGASNAQVDVLQAFRHDVQVALGKSVDRDDRSTLVLDVLGKYVAKYTEAMLQENKGENETLLIKQGHYLPSLFFEAGQIIGTHHDYNREKIKEANDHMIRLFRIGMETAMNMRHG